MRAGWRCVSGACGIQYVTTVGLQIDSVPLAPGIGQTLKLSVVSSACLREFRKGKSTPSTASVTLFFASDETLNRGPWSFSSESPRLFRFFALISPSDETLNRGPWRFSSLCLV